MEFQQPMMSKIPDTVTLEALIYGSAYADVKVRIMEIDHELDIVDDRKRSILSEMDLDAADHICSEFPDVMYTEAPISDDSDAGMVETVEQLREYNRLELARMWFEDARKRIELGGRTIGATERALKLNGRYDEDTWRTASLIISQIPLEYASLKVR